MKSGLNAVIGGEGCGKTTFICLLLKTLNRQDPSSSVGFKPFETGLSRKNAAEITLDSEQFYRLANPSFHENHCGLYTFHEDYPPFFAAACEGVRIKSQLYRQRLDFLEHNYRNIFIELPSGVLSPLFSDTSNILSQFTNPDQPAFYLLNTAPETFGTVLSDLLALRSAGNSCRVIINNLENSVDVKWLAYMWETVQSLTGFEVKGIIPYLPSNRTFDDETIDTLITQLWARPSN